MALSLIALRRGGGLKWVAVTALLVSLAARGVMGNEDEVDEQAIAEELAFGASGAPSPNPTAACPCNGGQRHPLDDPRTLPAQWSTSTSRTLST